LQRRQRQQKAFHLQNPRLAPLQIAPCRPQQILCWVAVAVSCAELLPVAVRHVSHPRQRLLLHCHRYPDTRNCMLTTTHGECTCSVRQAGPQLVSSPSACRFDNTTSRHAHKRRHGRRQALAIRIFPDHHRFATDPKESISGELEASARHLACMSTLPGSITEVLGRASTPHATHRVPGVFCRASLL